MPINLVPIIVDDGNYETAQQVDAALPSFPFSNKGDCTTFIQEVTMRQDVDYFTRPVIGTARVFPLGSSYFDPSFNIVPGSGYFPQSNGTSYLVSVTPAQLVGGRLIEWRETYATVPVRRVEYGSVTASVQYFVGAVLDATWSGICDGAYVYEYSLGEPLPALYSYYNDPAGGIVIDGPDNGNNLTLPGGYTQSQNSTSKIWMGTIYERVTTFANFPPIDWTP